MKVKIKELTFKTIIGILSFERLKPQRVIVNLSFEYAYKKGKFIDYKEVSDIVKKEMKKKKFGLIEDAVIELKKTLNKKYNMKRLKIEIIKPDILKNAKVSIKK